MPAGAEVTTPLPVPPRVTVSSSFIANAAPTETSGPIVITQVPVPEHAPVQPMKFEPASAVAVSVTEVPLVNMAEHAAPQSTPPGADVTVPVPLPVTVTVRRAGS